MAGSFNVDIQGLDTLTALLKEAPTTVEPILQQAIVTASDVLAKYTARPQVPYRTGFLIQTFRRDVQRLMARWFPTASYAKWVEDGTDPHWIEPTSGYLYWKGAPHPMARVFHPGTKGQPYMESILAAAKSDINDVFRQAISAAIAKLSS